MSAARAIPEIGRDSGENHSGYGAVAPLTVASDIDSAIRCLLAESIRRCPKSREQIAEQMSALTGQGITKVMLNDYVARSKSARFPAVFVMAFCAVVGDDRLQRFLLDRRLRNLLELGEHSVEVNRLRGEIAESATARQRKPKVKKAS